MIRRPTPSLTSRPTRPGCRAARAAATLAAALLPALLPGAGALAQDLLVTSFGTDSVKRYAWPSGAYVGDFVPPGSGGLSDPAGIRYAPDGSLLVASHNTSAVLRYDGQSGAFLGAFVPSLSGGLTGPWGIDFGPDGNLLTTDAVGPDHIVRRYDDLTGGYLGEFASTPGAFQYALESAGGLVYVGTSNGVYKYDAGGTLLQLLMSGGANIYRGLLVAPSGNLLAANWIQDSVQQLNGSSGALMGNFVSPQSGGLDAPEDLVYGPNGNLFVAASGAFQRVLEYDGSGGAFVRVMVASGAGGLSGPLGLAFMPPPIVDCNGNGVADDLDIASGTSGDCDGTGVPDECEIADGTSEDCDGTGVPDACELADGTSPDCNGNLVPDECDVAGGFSADADGDGVPDECAPPGDVDGDGDVDVDDLVILVLSWGVCPGCPADLDGDGMVDVDDLIILILSWT